MSKTTPISAMTTDQLIDLMHTMDEAGYELMLEKDAYTPEELAEELAQLDATKNAIADELDRRIPQD